VTVIRAAVGYVLAAGFFYVILAHIAGFSTRQSIVLAALIAWLAVCIVVAYAVLTPARRFSPHYVRVDPNWYDLLNDFKLIDGIDAWHAIRKFFEGLPATEYCVVRSGVCFTVVQQSEDFERTLIYLDNHRTFVSEVDLEEGVEPLRIGRIDKISEAMGKPSKCDVRLFVRFGADGYKLGIRVPSQWWNEVKASCPKPTEEVADYPTGQVDLILAIVSYREFDSYWEPAAWSSTFYDKTAKEIRRRRDEQRVRFGWKTVEHDSDLGAELGIDWPESIKHKYFNVDHRAI
jgi:hypothetical protein